MKFFLPYPLSANKYWRNVNGRMVVSAEAKEYKNTVGWLAKGAGIRPHVGDVFLKILLHPKTKKDGEASNVRVDLDNVLKVMCDALNGIAFADDKQITKINLEISHPIQNGGLSVTIGGVDD